MTEKIEHFEDLARSCGASQEEIDYIKSKFPDCTTSIVFTTGQFDMFCLHWSKFEGGHGSFTLYPKNNGLELSAAGGIINVFSMELLYLKSEYFKTNVGPTFIENLTNYWRTWRRTWKGHNGNSKMVLLRNPAKSYGGWEICVFDELVGEDLNVSGGSHLLGACS